MTVRYQVYGHDLTVRTNHIDGTHALLHGPATYLFADHLRAAPATVEVAIPGGWHLACGLAPAGGVDGGPARLVAASVDELLDSPIHLGVGQRRTFTAAGVPFELVVWGELAPGGAYDLDRLAADLVAIADDHAARAGETPFDRYAYVLMVSHDAYGGLEHRASSINLTGAQSLGTRKAYERLLELLSHELFHAWNGKRIAPAVLTDFDYRGEAYTRCLWIVEGVTSHYDRWTLRSSRRIEARSYLEKVLDDWTKLIATPGRRRHSLEDSSFDAWIKLYKPDESNLDTTVSYYLKGGLVMFALDLAIRRRTDGARSLDDALRALWRGFGARGVPYPEDVQPIFEDATGLDLGEVFARQIRGTEDPDLAAELAEVGLELRASHDPSLTEDGAVPVWLDARVSGVRVTAVPAAARRRPPAWRRATSWSRSTASGSAPTATPAPCWPCAGPATRSSWRCSGAAGCSA